MVWCLISLNKLGAQVLPPNEMVQIVREVIFSILNTSFTILLWFFGIRGMSNRGKK
jgi:cellobiose-specific phosphotransferase system component IIC